MVEISLRRNLKATIQVVSPLHVGAGNGHLVNDLDFISDRGTVWVIDREKLLERFTDEELRYGIPESACSNLKPGEYEEYAAYSLSPKCGRRDRPYIKDVEGEPTCPVAPERGSPHRDRLGSGRESSYEPKSADLERSAKRAASRWEKRVFGLSPNYDLMRSLLVDDSDPLPPGSLELDQVSIYTIRGSVLESWGANLFSVEALRPGSVLSCRVGISDSLLSQPALGLSEKRRWIDKLCSLGRERAAELISAEKAFYQQHRLIPLSRFYDQLERLSTDLAENQFLLQLSWGTGWSAKTVGSALTGSGLLEKIRSVYRLGRPGSTFPRSRRLVERGGAPSEPLGWVRVTVGE